MARNSNPSVAIQLVLQDGPYDHLRARWEEIEALGADAIYVSDHFVALRSRGDESTYEAMTVLAALAEATERVNIGTMVLGNSFRNPNLVADMARTIDLISGGRMVLGLGSGYVQEEYELYGYDYGTTGSRLRDLEAGLKTIAVRLPELKPPPLRKIPILIGGAGEKVTLRLAAQYADVWNILASDPDVVAHKLAVLDDWCEQVGRDSTEITRSAHVAYGEETTIRDPNPFFELGCTEFVVASGGPDWSLDTLRELLAWRDGLDRSGRPGAGKA